MNSSRRSRSRDGSWIQSTEQENYSEAFPQLDSFYNDHPGLRYGRPKTRSEWTRARAPSVHLHSCNSDLTSSRPSLALSNASRSVGSVSPSSSSIALRNVDGSYNHQRIVQSPSGISYRSVSRSARGISRSITPHRHEGSGISRGSSRAASNVSYSRLPSYGNERPFGDYVEYPSSQSQGQHSVLLSSQFSATPDQYDSRTPQRSFSDSSDEHHSRTLHQYDLGTSHQSDLRTPHQHHFRTPHQPDSRVQYQSDSETSDQRHSRTQHQPDSRTPHQPGSRTQHQHDSGTSDQRHSRTQHQHDSRTPHQPSFRSQHQSDSETSDQRHSRTPHQPDSRTPHQPGSRTQHQHDSRTRHQSDSETSDQRHSRTPHQPSSRTRHQSDSETSDQPDSKTPHQPSSRTQHQSDSETSDQRHSRTPHQPGSRTRHQSDSETSDQPKQKQRKLQATSSSHAASPYDFPSDDQHSAGDVPAEPEAFEDMEISGIRRSGSKSKGKKSNDPVKRPGTSEISITRKNLFTTSTPKPPSSRRSIPANPEVSAVEKVLPRKSAKHGVNYSELGDGDFRSPLKKSSSGKVKESNGLIKHPIKRTKSMTRKEHGTTPTPKPSASRRSISANPEDSDVGKSLPHRSAKHEVNYSEFSDGDFRSPPEKSSSSKVKNSNDHIKRPVKSTISITRKKHGTTPTPKPSSSRRSIPSNSEDSDVERKLPRRSTKHKVNYSELGDGDFHSPLKKSSFAQKQGSTSPKKTKKKRIMSDDSDLDDENPISTPPQPVRKAPRKRGAPKTPQTPGIQIDKRVLQLIKPKEGTDGLRRSRRTRVANYNRFCLERYGQLPRIVYKYEGNERVIAGVELPGPLPKKPRKRGKKGIPGTPVNLSVHHVPRSIDIPEEELRGEEPEALDFVHRRKDDVLEKITRDGKCSSCTTLRVWMKNACLQDGYIELKGHGMKAPAKTAFAMIGNVARGRLSLTVDSKTTMIESGDRFKLTSGQVYELCNLRSDVAKVNYMIMKLKPSPKAQRSPSPTVQQSSSPSPTAQQSSSRGAQQSSSRRAQQSSSRRAQQSSSESSM